MQVKKKEKYLEIGIKRLNLRRIPFSLISYLKFELVNVQISNHAWHFVKKKSDERS